MPAAVDDTDFSRSLQWATCRSCGHRKQLREFPRDCSRPNGRHPYCKRCKAAKQRDSNHRRMRAKNEAPTRPCSVCQKTRQAEDFSSPRAWKCRACKEKTAARQKKDRREKSRAWYQANKHKKRLHLALLRDNRKLQLLELRGGICVDCGLFPSEEWPVGCFDFHHDSDDKEHSLARLLHSAQKWNLAVAEAEKCVVVCANCHRKRHWTQKRKEMHDECTG